eukprot:9141536-Heterocapsa_arctica.AAC.1
MRPAAETQRRPADGALGDLPAEETDSADRTGVAVPLTLPVSPLVATCARDYDVNPSAESDD